MTHSIPSRAAYTSNLDLFSPTETDVSHTNSIVVPVYSQTNIRESQVPLEFSVSSLEDN